MVSRLTNDDMKSSLIIYVMTVYSLKINKNRLFLQMKPSLAHFTPHPFDPFFARYARLRTLRASGEPITFHSLLIPRSFLFFIAVNYPQMYYTSFSKKGIAMRVIQTGLLVFLLVACAGLWYTSREILNEHESLRKAIDAIHTEQHQLA